MFDTDTSQREEQMKNLEIISMSNIGIPANADNKVVAGENAKSIYAVVEVFYTSIAGREYGCEYIFNDLADAKKYVQERLESYLKWTIVYHECDPTDQEEMDEFNEYLESTFDDEDMVYGYYPFDGDKNFLEYHIKEVKMFNE